jgi:hypothetical protein
VKKPTDKFHQDHLDIEMMILDEYITNYNDLMSDEREDDEKVKEAYKTYSPEEHGGDSSC